MKIYLFLLIISGKINLHCSQKNFIPLNMQDNLTLLGEGIKVIINDIKDTTEEDNLEINFPISIDNPPIDFPMKICILKGFIGCGIFCLGIIMYLK
jgi:hypothetical protein